jgi:hypothetical protein
MPTGTHTGSVQNVNKKPTSKRIQKMKVLAKFLGKVNEYNEPPALSYVTLKNVDTGTSEDATIFSEKLKEKGITHADCEFEVLVFEDDAGKQTGTITKLEPLPVSDAELKAISDEVDAKLPPGNPPCFDI